MPAVLSRFKKYLLFSKVRCTTNGNLISSPVYQDIDGIDELTDLSDVEELTLFSLQEGGTNLFRWNLYMFGGLTRASEVAAGPWPIGTTVAGNSSIRQAAYTTIVNFYPASRFVLGTGNFSGGNNEIGTVTAWLGVKRVGQ